VNFFFSIPVINGYSILFFPSFYTGTRNRSIFSLKTCFSSMCKEKQSTTYHSPLTTCRRYHFLHHFISSRTKLDVLFMHMSVVFHFLSQMGKAGTVGRSDIVDTALIVFKIQELAGKTFIYPVSAASFFLQPFLFKFSHCLSKMG